MTIESVLAGRDFHALHLSSRREFIRNLSMGAALLALSTGGCEAILEAIRKRPIRRRVNPSSPESMAALEIYKAAITLMKGLPSSDPRSWNNQAGIHGTVTAGFLKCQHGTWFFLPWHRAYLFYFEQICRELTGEKGFGLPYWNWSIDTSILAPFWEAGSPLLFSPRSATASSVANGTIVGHDNMESILDEPNFLLFGSSSSAQGRLESGPHNYIHGFVGGTMGTGGSALDPIFWTHHCMIDYCWVDWNINRDHDNTNDSAWMETKWSDHFVDGNGDSVEASVAATILMPFLSYQYEPSQIGTSTLDAFARSKADIRRLKARVEKGAAIELAIRRRIPFSPGVDLSTSRAIPVRLPVRVHEIERLFVPEQSERALVSIGFAHLPQSNDFFVRVFVNKSDASPRTGTDDPHYAGSFAFFGTSGQPGGAHAHHKPVLIVDISDALRRLREGGLLRTDDAVSLSFVAVPVEPGRSVKDERLKMENLELLISPVRAVERHAPADSI